ncbi:aromatase/cyclase [Kitasatospora atroaurantiaca]|uniref:Ribosome-associated toxin RatA of RatAB toxin-antitoxin module n=1 Tax=Kitasatospora atroaurantiaca TaxID=285545 RepID=A0A561EVF1_9ACTN|nr:SRPBCC family protein [Kitasatospora atroaurantiaca]TWE19594.1 ribosome-associated toxin RatA of RatAB toxin-antitoxin module [Kitasatospora atroaurantiaca]
MRHVELDAVVRNERAEDVFDNVLKWERYPELAPHVRATTVHSTLPEPVGSSSWELHFRSGLLRWTEDDHFLRNDLEVRFEQTDGDFDSFEGKWVFRQDGDDVAVHFEADFDFGIPSLEGILDPIAERVIKETVAWAVTGLFASVSITGDVDLGTPAAATA